MTRKLQYGRYEQLKVLAADFIEDYALSYPLDPFYIADLLGLHVTVHQRGLPPTGWLCSTSDGYTVPVEAARSLKFQVHVNGATPLLRQRFTLTHEIAHVWLNHPRGDGPASDDATEAEANFLAGYLLAPDVLVLKWVPELTVAGIAQEFQVSDEAAGIIHGRVVRSVNTKAQGRDYDRRISLAAVKCFRDLDLGREQEAQGSA